MEILDKRGAAQLLGCSIRQIDNLRIHSGLPWVAIGALVRFDKAEILEWLEGQRRKGGPNQTKPETKDSDSK